MYLERQPMKHPRLDDLDGELSDEEVGNRIREHRAAQVSLTFTGPDGKPAAGRGVTVRRTAHKFLFGGCHRAGQNRPVVLSLV